MPACERWVEDADAFVSLGYVAAAVRNARIGTGIARAFARAPLIIATAAANLQELTDGRFILGLGSGTKRQNLQQLGVEFDHAGSRVAELCSLLRLVCGSPEDQALEIKGQFYNLSLDGLALERARCQPPPPIHLAAVNDFMIRTAGRICDGLICHPCFSVKYLQKVVIPQFTIGLHDSRWDRSHFDLSSLVITYINNDSALEKRRTAYQIGYYFTTKSYGHVLGWHGMPHIQEKLRKALFERLDWESLAD